MRPASSRSPTPDVSSRDGRTSKIRRCPDNIPFSVRSGAGPADDFAVDLRNNGGITTSDGLKPRLLILGRSPPAFIGGDAVLDALIVNFSNRSGIVYAGAPNVDAVDAWTFERAITPVPLRPLLHRSLARTPVAPRARPAWRTSLAAGIFGPPASRADHLMSSELRSCRLSQDREMLGAFPSLPRRLLPFSFIVIIEAEAWLMAQPCPLNLISSRVPFASEIDAEMNFVAAGRIIAVHEDGGVRAARRNFAAAANDRGSLPGKVLPVRCSCSSEEAGGVAAGFRSSGRSRGGVVEIEAGARCSRQAEPAHQRLVAMVAAAQGEPALVGERGEIVRMRCVHDEPDDARRERRSGQARAFPGSSASRSSA